MKSLITIVSAVLLFSQAKADDWYPSRYGPEDSLGALNLVSAENAVKAARLVKTGKTYALGVLTGAESPAFGVRTYNMVLIPGGDGSGASLGTNKTTFNDDFLSTYVGIGTQIDGLGHLGINHQYYNGAKQSEIFQGNGLKRFGTHTLPPIVTRGVLLDITALAEVEMLAGGTAINQDEIEKAAKRQEVEIGKGDVVLLHTGWQSLSETDPKKFMASAPGLGKQGAQYLAAKGVVAVGADTWGMEVIPAEDPNEAFPVHQELLARNGVYILENIDTSELARDQVSEFMFVLGVPRFVGPVQMVVNPVAIR